SDRFPLDRDGSHAGLPRRQPSRKDDLIARRKRGFGLHCLSPLTTPPVKAFRAHSAAMIALALAWASPALAESTPSTLTVAAELHTPAVAPFVGALFSPDNALAGAAA